MSLESAKVSVFCCGSVYWLKVSSQMEDSEGTVRQIGAFSEGIQNLTVTIKVAYHWQYNGSLIQGLLLYWHFFLCCLLTEHAERRRVLQRDFTFTEPQLNRRRLQRLSLSIRPDPAANETLCQHFSTRTQTRFNKTPRTSQHFLVVLHSKKSQKYYSICLYVLYYCGNILNTSWFLEVFCTL